MIPVDTFDSTGTETNFCGPFSQESGLYDKPNGRSSDENNYDFPAGPAGGGGTAPSLPGLGGGSLPSSSSGPLPGLGGAGYEQASSSGSGGGGMGNLSQWLNPQTLGAGLGLIASVSQNRSPDKARIKAVCGRRPLLNIGGKKDAYNQCAQNLMMPVYQAPLPTTNRDSSNIIIWVVAVIILIAIIVAVVVLMKRNAAPVKA